MLQISDCMIFGLHTKTNVVELDNVIVLFCLLGRFHIHKARGLNTKPTFRRFCFAHDNKLSTTDSYKRHLLLTDFFVLDHIDFDE